MPALATSPTWYRELRTLLVLGRVSNLPTVWSNCLAGWLLAGGRSWAGLALLCLGASCLYVGGMFLNDAFDAEFDRQYRIERPIPSGAITAGKVWGWGWGWLGAGVLLLSLLGTGTMAMALLLTACILLYDAIHKAVTLSPLIMGACRFLLYVLAATAARSHASLGLAIWSGLALAGYVVGLSYLARKETVRSGVQYWPCVLLAIPILLAAVVNVGPYKVRAMVVSILLALWIIRCMSNLWGQTISIGRTVSGLLAGICLVDWLAVGGGTPLIGAVFLLLFALALLGQRFIPAT
jgi:hypothetical protein